MVQSCQSATTGRGKSYLRMKLYDQDGRLWSAVWWEGRDEVPAGTIVDAVVESSEYNGEEQLTVQAMRSIKGDPSEFMPRSRAEPKALMAELQGYVSELRNEHLQDLLGWALGDERWLRTPAATQMHHAYLGGLLDHTTSLVRLARVVCPLYPEADQDQVVAGLVLHDYGKVEELNCGANIEYSVIGELLGHIAIGLMQLDRLIERVPNFPPELRLRMLHIVGSHHGQKAYGAVKEPLTLEAAIVCKLDGLDAEVAAIRAAVEKAKPGDVWSQKIKFEKKFYLGEGGKK